MDIQVHDEILSQTQETRLPLTPISFCFWGKDLSFSCLSCSSVFVFVDLFLCFLSKRSLCSSHQREEMRRTTDSFYCPCLLTFTSPCSAQSYILRHETERTGRNNSRHMHVHWPNVTLCASSESEMRERKVKGETCIVATTGNKKDDDEDAPS
jgi:hypothetical protein